MGDNNGNKREFHLKKLDRYLNKQNKKTICYNTSL